MTSPITGKHEKHTALARAACGEWGRHELAIAGLLTWIEAIKKIVRQNQLAQMVSVRHSLNTPSISHSQKCICESNLIPFKEKHG